MTDQPRRRLVTSSWDDGDPLDLRLAERLVGAGWAPTFYLCRDYDGRPRLSDGEIRALDELPRVELGAHTLTHPDLRRVDEVRLQEEVAGSKRWLEDLLGHEVRAFCYPKGLHNRRAAAAVVAAGYALARTTLAGWTSRSFDPFRMPTTAQFFTHSRATQMRHALKEGNLRGLRTITTRAWPQAPAALGESFVTETADAKDAVLHFWGHSWELDEHGLWDELDRLLRVVAETDVEHVTNSGVVDRMPDRSAA